MTQFFCLPVVVLQEAEAWYFMGVFSCTHSSFGQWTNNIQLTYQLAHWILFF